MDRMQIHIMSLALYHDILFSLLQSKCMGGRTLVGQRSSVFSPFNPGNVYENKQTEIATPTPLIIGARTWKMFIRLSSLLFGLALSTFKCLQCSASLLLDYNKPECVAYVRI